MHCLFACVEGERRRKREREGGRGRKKEGEFSLAFLC